LSHTAASATRSTKAALCAGSSVAGSPCIPMRRVWVCAGEARARKRRMEARGSIATLMSDMQSRSLLPHPRMTMAFIGPADGFVPVVRAPDDGRRAHGRGDQVIRRSAAHLSRAYREMMNRCETHKSLTGEGSAGDRIRTYTASSSGTFGLWGCTPHSVCQLRTRPRNFETV